MESKLVVFLSYTIRMLYSWYIENKAGYMATPVACGWAVAVIVVNCSLGQYQ